MHEFLTVCSCDSKNFISQLLIFSNKINDGFAVVLRYIFWLAGPWDCRFFNYILIFFRFVLFSWTNGIFFAPFPLIICRIAYLRSLVLIDLWIVLPRSSGVVFAVVFLRTILHWFSSLSWDLFRKGLKGHQPASNFK